jgi:glucose-1-phosphate thymidylyltransferase
MIEHEENFRLGVPFFDADGNLEKVVEKPEKPPNRYGVPGLYFFNSHVFEAFEGVDAVKPSARGELEITDLYSYLLAHGYRVETEEVEGRWMDPGKFTDMLDANAYMLDQMKLNSREGEIDRVSQLFGHVAVGRGTRIVSSRIEGPVVIGDNCLVEGSVIGPHSSIGQNTKLEEVNLENAIVMQDTTILNVKRIIKDSLIGKNTEIWEEKEESVSLFIGDHCKIRLT